MKRTDAPITRRKYAVLDTDFISKANTVRHGNHLLADEVLSFPDYCFFAHRSYCMNSGEEGQNLQ